MSIRDAFDKALRRLKLKASSSSSSSSISQIAIEAEKEIKEKRVPRYPDNSNVVYFNPNVHYHYKEAVNKKSYLLNDRCDGCDLKKKEKTKESTEEAIKKVFEDLNKLTDEEFKAKLDDHKEKCDPKTCWGECQGQGWCHIAQEWQQKIHAYHFNFTKYVKVKKVRSKQNKKKRKELKKKWKQIHNQRRRKK